MCVCVCVCACVYVSAGVRVRVCANVCVHVCAYMCVCEWGCVCVHACERVCVDVYCTTLCTCEILQLPFPEVLAANIHARCVQSEHAYDSATAPYMYELHNILVATTGSDQ
jgi:hypothetical protein